MSSGEEYTAYSFITGFDADRFKEVLKPGKITST